MTLMPLLKRVMTPRVIIHMVAKRVFMVILRLVQENHMVRVQSILKGHIQPENLQKVQEKAEVIVMDQSLMALMITDPTLRNQSSLNPTQNPNL